MAELALRASLGEPPAVDDEPAFSVYQATYAARLLDLPVYPPGVLGVALWASATLACRYAERCRQLAAAPPVRVPSAEELEEWSQAADDYEEDVEWRIYEGQVRLSQIEALRGASSGLAADYLEDGLDARAGGGGAGD